MTRWKRYAIAAGAGIASVMAALGYRFYDPPVVDSTLDVIEQVSEIYGEY